VSKLDSDRKRRRNNLVKKLLKITGRIPERPLKAGVYQIVSEMQVDDLHYTEVWYTVDDECEVPALLLQSDTTDVRRLCIALHQTTEPRTIGKREPAGLEGRPSLYYGQELAKRGYKVICPDYPLFGTYQVDIDRIYKKFAYSSIVAKGVVNQQVAIDVAENFFRISAEKVSAVGHSLGGTNAIFLGIFDDRVQNVVCSAGFSEFESYEHRSKTGDLSGWARRDKYMPLIQDRFQAYSKQMPITFAEIISLLEGKNLFFNVPKDDDIFSHESAAEVLNNVSKNLFGNETSIASFFPDGGHDFPDDARLAAYEYVASK
jgi:pimeloyl-ACP methyl ester carboxylesterase